MFVGDVLVYFVVSDLGMIVELLYRLIYWILLILWFYYVDGWILYSFVGFYCWVEFLKILNIELIEIKVDLVI